MIRVENLTRSFGEVRALAGISFQVERGEVVGFLGPNGAGKSTAMRILTGFLAADGGRAAIDGHAVDGSPAEARAARSRVGYLPESTPLYRGMRVDEYLGFIARVRGLGRAERARAFERVVVDCDLGPAVRRRIHQLSKGYRQRVGLAQALIGDPDVLVLDEPTSGLDPAEIVRIRDLVRRLGEHKTVLLSTHVLPEVQEMCPRVIILAGGRIVADGTPLDLAAGEEPRLHVGLRAPRAEAERELAELPGAAELRFTGSDAAGGVGFTLASTDRRGLAERVAHLAAERGWPIFELRHDVPSLETVFLHRTMGRGADTSGMEIGGPFGEAAAVSGGEEPGGA